LTEPEARSVLAAAGVVLPETSVAESAEEAAELWGRFSAPVAVKLVSARFMHKSDVGGVILDVTDPHGAADAFERIEAAVRLAAQAMAVDIGPVAVMMTPMLPAPRAELLVGAYRDPQLGPVLTLGAGGIWVESDRDVAHRLLPVADDEVDRQLDELRIGGRLGGARGLRPVERRPLVDAIQAIASVLQRCPDVAEAEVNPLFAYERGVACVDARIVLGPG
jgi:acetyltransferase